MVSGTVSEAVLIHLSGPDGAGVTAGAAAALAAHNASLLDIGQTVVHGRLALRMLVEIAAGTDVDTVQSGLRGRANELGLQAEFKRIAPGAAQHGLCGLGEDGGGVRAAADSADDPGADSVRAAGEAAGVRAGVPATQYIVTMLARALTFQHLARVSGVVGGHGMNIDRIERLSGRLSGQLAPGSAEENACLELAVSGDAAREAGMRAEFLAIAQQESIDIAFQREGMFRRDRRLFVFDMDSTLIQGEVIDELAKLAGAGEDVARITEAAMRGELDFDESFTRRVALLKGLPEERVHSVLHTIPLADGAERLIRTLKSLGYKTAILSGGFNFFARSLQERLGIDCFHSNELEIVDGAVTGRVIPPIINGARKAALLAEIAAREGISLEQVVAVGDGANDIPMLDVAGMGIAYRAKAVVREKADQSISCLGLDGLLYLIGVRDRDMEHDEAREK